MIENAREKAGRKGGKATAKSHDKNFYEKLGEKGGEKTAKTHDKVPITDKKGFPIVIIKEHICLVVRKLH
ncbi:hypothetical protein [Pediococcus parvulus]|uniref:hypothetical protein n=1 Tax=Pediococcus parvulus TaxID=54062 RepID=UPI00345E230E